MLRLCAWHGQAVEVPLRVLRVAVDHLGPALLFNPNLLALHWLQGRVQGVATLHRGDGVWHSAAHGSHVAQYRVGTDAVVVGVGLFVIVRVTVDALHQGELLSAHGPLLFLVGVVLVVMGKKCVLVGKGLRAVSALQVGLLRALGVAGEHVLLQQLNLAKGVLVDHLHPQVVPSVPGERNR